MNLRRTTFLAGAAALLVSIVLLVTAVSFIPGIHGGASWLLALNLPVGQCLAGACLMIIARRTVVSRSVVRPLAALLAFSSMAGLVYLMFTASIAPRMDSVKADAPEIALEYLLIAHAGNFSVALSVIALTLSGRRRAGAAAAGALGVTSALLGVSTIVCWAVSLQAAAPGLLDTLLMAGTLAAIGGGLFCAAKEELDRSSATHQTAPVDHKLAVATGTCLGLILFTGILWFGFAVRDSEDFSRLVQMDHLQQVLQAIDDDVHATASQGRQIIAGGSGDTAAFTRTARDLAVKLTELSSLASDPRQASFVPVVRDLATGLLNPLRRAVELQRAGRSVEAGEILASLEMDNLLERFDTGVTELTTSLNAEIADRAEPRAHRHRAVAVVAPVAGMAIIALLGTIHLFFERQSTARHRSESALRRHNETLRGFAHTVAHDLRAPLRGIAGYASELDGHAHLVGARGRHCINQINTSAQNLERLIGDTLDYAQLDAETPRLTSIVLPTLVASLLQQRAEEIRKHGTRVDTHFAINEVTSWERGLVQIIGNLLDNAIKYSRHAHPPRVRIETAQTPLSWRLVIYDNGIGFDMKYHDRIFGLFQRLVTTDEFEGTGAGLAIVRKITDRLGGRVYAEGRPGSGATFLVELPRITSSDLV